MKRLLTVFFIFSGILLLSGCDDTTNLGSRALIQAAAIDYDNGYRVSALLFSGGGSGGDTIDASQENVIKVTGFGKTLSEAVDAVSLADGKEIFMCETKLIILGGGFETESAIDALKTLWNEMRVSLNTPVCCCDSAEMLTDLKFTEGITSAEKPLSMINNAYELGAFPKTTLLDLLADFKGGVPTLVPYFTESENGRGMTTEDDGKTALLCGSRIMNDGKFTDVFSAYETRGKMLLLEKSDRIFLNYNFNNSEKTCEAYGIKIKSDANGKITVSAKFRTRQNSPLPEEERKTALCELTKIIEGAL